jgi:hypothetical protein
MVTLFVNLRELRLLQMEKLSSLSAIYQSALMHRGTPGVAGADSNYSRTHQDDTDGDE